MEGAANAEIAPKARAANVATDLNNMANLKIQMRVKVPAERMREDSG